MDPKRHHTHICTIQRILKKRSSIKWGILRTAVIGLKEQIDEDSDDNY